jgi:L,D-transpeptidase ErfK/SrfK
MKYYLALFFMISASNLANALLFQLPANGDTLIGETAIATAQYEDTLVDIARRNSLGFEEIVNANPEIDTWMPKPGTKVVLPHRTLLPTTPLEGIVVNVAEMRLYYYPPSKAADNATVESFPVSIGRSDWNTPLVITTVARKAANPSWRPPKSIQEEHALEGDILPDVVAAGPDNPLGLYALYLGVPSYLIHGTNKVYGIGMQVTHGCIRMYPEDIEHLYNTVAVGTPVRIVNQPFKAGWYNDVLYIEVHPWLEGTPVEQAQDKMLLVDLILSMLSDYPNYPVDWTTVEIARVEANGQPIAIGPRRGNIFEDEFQ